ncbi:MAG TPA: purine-nucleoside phosphorylase [Bacteroidetes bacterium]|nr:purine-nucleoside phosphorylase [Bacteroidota bacterium]
MNELKKFLIHRGFNEKVDCTIILGSGLGGFTTHVDNAISVDYSDIPGFPKVTVEGHGGELIQGTVNGKKVLVFSGRFHHYEGHPFDKTLIPVQISALFSSKTLIVSNAAGGINPRFSVGDLMLIDDMMRVGFAIQPLGKPFQSRYENTREIETAIRVANELQITVKRGTYMYVKGPVYETKAEIRAYRLMGADAVGMSTMPELLLANELGIRTLGISLITNLATGLSKNKLEHAEIKDVADSRKNEFATLVCELISQLG